MAVELLGSGEIYQELEAAFEGDPKLAVGEEMLGKGWAEVFHDVSSNRDINIQ